MPPAETWATYQPATEIWSDAGDVGLGEIDAGEYTMVSRQITDSVIYPIINQIASSALGYMYEDFFYTMHKKTDLPISVIYAFFIIEATNAGIESNCWLHK